METGLNSNENDDKLINTREKRIRKQKIYDDDYVLYDSKAANYQKINFTNGTAFFDPCQTGQNSAQLNSTSSNDQSFTYYPTSSELLKYHANDLVWAKVSGHPWWPCMISSDVNENNAHVKSIGSSRSKRLYFVEFFGPSVEHAWVNEGCLIEYKGIEAFKTYAQDEVDQAPTKSQKEKLAERFQLKVALTRRDHWERAVQEADEALSKRKAERKQYFYDKTMLTGSILRKSKANTNDLNDVAMNSDEENVIPKRIKLKVSRESSSSATNDSVYQMNKTKMQAIEMEINKRKTKIKEKEDFYSDTSQTEPDQNVMSNEFINNEDPYDNDQSNEIETLTSIMQSHHKTLYKTMPQINVDNEDSQSTNGSSAPSSALSSTSLTKQCLYGTTVSRTVEPDNSPFDDIEHVDTLKSLSVMCNNPVVSIVDEDSLNNVQQRPLQQKILKKRGRKPKSQTAKTKSDAKSVTTTVVRGNKRYIGVRKCALDTSSSGVFVAQQHMPVIDDLQQQQPYCDYYGTTTTTPTTTANSPISNFHFNNTLTSNEDEEEPDYVDDNDVDLDHLQLNHEDDVDDDDDDDDEDEDDEDDNTSDDNYSDIEKINRKKQKKAKHTTTTTTTTTITNKKQIKKRRKNKHRTDDFIETILNEDPMTSKQLKSGSNVAETYLIDRYKYAVRHIKQGLSVEEACNKYRISKGALLKCLSGGTAPRGKKTRLNENEENSIVEWLIANQNLKYNDAIHLVFQEVVNIFEKGNRPNPFHNGKPSMDWWYDFLSRHPQIMASKPEWLRRGKVNDQYILDVQSGKLRCTKFRRALLSAIQYIRSLNDANSYTASTSSSNSNETAKAHTATSQSAMTLAKSSHNKRICNKTTKKLSSKTKKKKNLAISGSREHDISNVKRMNDPSGSELNGHGCVDLNNNNHFKTERQQDMENDHEVEQEEENNFIKTILSNTTTVSNPLVQLNTNDLDTKRLVVKVKFSNQHLLVADDDDDDDDDDIDKLKDSIDPSAFLP